MPTLNFNVKVKAGKRTPVEVECYYTAVNQETLTLINGVTVTNQEIAEFIAQKVCAALQITEGTQHEAR
jgi:hypothetical protein